ncbi:hypothetical protein [Winogradskyella ursingii]|uniref:hypothetical protein n=1 Tax=Winogradskyella ursingii TaxID=2686079 RepID=UPI0015C9F63C|nr:hypothetical protein [Winogradskyella ursingii]
MAFAQVKDKENKSIRIPAETSKKEKDSTPLKIKVAPKKDKDSAAAGGKINKLGGISKGDEKKFIIKETEKPFSMVHDDGLISPGQIFEKRWNKEAEKGGIIRTMDDQFLGEHRVDTKFVNIICRDHQYPDGDRVQIFINDVMVERNVLLTSSYRKIQVNLADGKNTIDIVALNQGDSGPNTAEFVVYDDKGNLISSKEWNLLTGVKATIIFNNEKTIIQPKDKVASSDEQASNDNK